MGVDFIKLLWHDANVKAIRNNKLLCFEARVNSDGEVKEEKAEYNKLTFIIRANSNVEIKGSLHEYWKDSNHSNFHHIELVEAIIDLYLKFDLPINEIKIQNIEFGVNIKPPLKTTKFIDSVYKYKSCCFDVRRFKATGYQLEYQGQRYYLKIYDKARDCKLNFDLVRFEIKVVKMVHLIKYDIDVLSDLLCLQKVAPLQQLLLKSIDSIIMDNPFVEYKNMSKRDKNSYNQMNKRSVWEQYKANYQKNRKARFYDVISRNSKRLLQGDFKELVAAKCQELTTYNNADASRLILLINSLEIKKDIADLTDIEKATYSHINRYSIGLNKLHVLHGTIKQFWSMKKVNS